MDKLNLKPHVVIFSFDSDRGAITAELDMTTTMPIWVIRMYNPKAAQHHYFRRDDDTWETPGIATFEHAQELINKIVKGIE